MGKVTFPQCAVGLVSPEELPLLKWTELWSNAPELLYPFEGLECHHTCHGEISGKYKGTSRSKLAQVWPTEMCRRIVEACQILIKHHRSLGVYPSVLDARPPGAPRGSGRGRGRPRKYPEGVVFDCPKPENLRLIRATLVETSLLDCAGIPI